MFGGLIPNSFDDFNTIWYIDGLYIRVWYKLPVAENKKKGSI